ncbi:MAG: hypothetical protein C9356_01140 [Oleiphilus sp.]|nr:MAG: hypothetical protein C9356_01140 [Oleiphilus sp.]
MIPKQTVSKLIVVISLLIPLNQAAAQQSIRIVTAPWAPYAYVENGKVTGTDVDISLAVLKQLGVEASIEMLPWKRALALVKQQEADAVLDASISPERQQFMYFPNEPVSIGTTVFFKRKSNSITSLDLDNASGLSVGAMLGYKYCEELDRSDLIKRASRVATLEQNFKKLLLNRVDLVVEVDAVGLYKIGEMGISNEISIVGNTHYCAGGNYLAFAKTPALKTLAGEFSTALEKFKKTAEYRQILSKYLYPSKL